MSIEEQDIYKVADIVQMFMDEYDIADPEPELQYTDDSVYITLHLEEQGPSVEDIDVLDLETRIGTIAGFEDIDITVELINPTQLGLVGTDKYEDGDDHDDNDDLHIRKVEEADYQYEEPCVDMDAEVILKEIVNENTLANIEVDDSYEATDADIQDLYDHFDDGTRLSELEDMGEWD